MPEPDLTVAAPPLAEPVAAPEPEPPLLPESAAGPEPEPPPGPEPVRQVPSPSPVPPPPPRDAQAPRRRAGWLWLLLPLILVLGLGGGYWLTRDGGPLASPRLPALEARVAALEPRLAAAESEAAAFRGVLAEAPDAADLAALGRRLDEMQAALDAALAEREKLRTDLDELARRPPEVADNRLSEEAVAAYQRELAAMRQMVEAELARVRAASEQASAEAAAAAEAGVSADSLAVLAEVAGALASGAAFAEPLDRLAALDPALPIDGLLPHATGVPPMTELQATFPEAARLALAADVEAQAGGGLGGFLRAQLGMRSLRPQTGDGADAVLSRAEDSLRAGDLARTLTELDALAGPAAEMMAEWRAKAQARAAAQKAYDDLEMAVRG